MLIVRPVRESDHASVMGLAKEAGTGMTSLPQDAEVMEAKIANAVASFAGNPKRPKEESFLFVMEDTVIGEVVGSCGIVAHIGLSRPFYSYKISTIVQASDEIEVYSLQRVLHMVNDYTGASEIGSLFLMPDYRRDGLGRFLSRCRYLMLAEFPQLFSDIVISEIRGVQNDAGESPFYKHLAQHFFQMEFRQADYINAIKGSQFIADLMPKYPIYVELLDKTAQDVIGVPFSASKAAKNLLESEGFTHQGYVDVFDAGPTMQAERSKIRTVRASRIGKVTEIRDIEGEAVMTSNRRLNDFTICMGQVAASGESVAISADTARALRVAVGDEIRFVPFTRERRAH